MIRILTRLGDVITSPVPLAEVEQAMADPDARTITVPNRFDFDEPVDVASIVAVWEAGPIELALGRRRTAREVVLEILHATPGLDRRQLHHSAAWRQAGWDVDPHPHTINTALLQLERGGQVARVGDTHQLTATGRNNVERLRDDHTLAA